MLQGRHPQKLITNPNTADQRNTPQQFYPQVSPPIPKLTGRQHIPHTVNGGDEKSHVTFAASFVEGCAAIQGLNRLARERQCGRKDVGTPNKRGRHG